jgi:hypothetical protein
MNDSRKTKKELIEELKSLRSKVDVKKVAEVDGDGGDEQTSGLTRREVLSGWVAPVILTVPLSSRTVLAETGSGGAQLEAVPTTVNFNIDSISPSFAPTWSPSQSPTFSPTNFPTNLPTTSPTYVSPTWSPTQSPTQMPTTQSPTMKPTSSPTQSPTGTPTAFPTAAPTVAVIPVELTDFEID